MTEKETSLNKKIGIRHTLLHTRKKNGGVTISGVLILRYQGNSVPRKFKFQIGTRQYQPKKLVNIKDRFIIYSIHIPLEDLITTGVHNTLFLTGSNTQGEGFKRKLSFLPFLRNSFLLHSPIIKFKRRDIAVVIRQGSSNETLITTRGINKTDSILERFKILLAFIISRILFFQKSLLLFEKECEKYEESASVLYEELLDQGYKNAYFVLGGKGKKKYSVPSGYKKNILNRFSFRHYLKFFQAKTFLATESPYHAVELRTLSRLVHFKIGHMQYKYVFLQHGVMYMVSLDAPNRYLFRYGRVFKDNARIVVSSEKEAEHFKELGGFPSENLIVSGLPKFDRNIQHKEADKIAIMATWRPWEFADLRVRAEDTKYFKMLNEMLEAIPTDLKDKTVIIPHPLVQDNFKDTSLSRYFAENQSIDEILRDVSLLITDYSSIAYDAFSRGSNVIFWWKEKDYCMDKYKAHLMLNKENIFGDIVYNEEELKKAIKENYNKKQKETYKKRYKSIVQFDDNQNTQRLIKALKKDNYL
jgi:CDP-glycerol glycerophosphotransferase (TagB/SpsB family)